MLLLLKHKKLERCWGRRGLQSENQSDLPAPHSSGHHSNWLYYLQNEQQIKEKEREQQRAYRQKNKEAIKEYFKQYRHKNQQAIKESQRRYISKNKESMREWRREYRRNNKDLINRNAKRHTMKNKEAIRVQKRLYYIKNKDAISKKQREYYINHKETIENQKRIYVTNNLERVKEQQRGYYLKKRAPRKTRTWTNLEQVKLFFEDAKTKLHINDPTDWYRVSTTQISQIGGGSLKSAFGSLGKALQFAYPEVPWDLSKFSYRGKKSTQRWLRVMLQLILPEQTDLIEDFLHPDLLWDQTTNVKMELDIWVPKYLLALEYQGEQHYYDLHCAYGPNGTAALYTERDLIKKKTCTEKGITLATIPYWWDGKKESLASSLHQLRPDVFPKTDFPAIPPTPPNIPTHNQNPSISTLLMHGYTWNKEQDTTGWFISEKMDGFRAFWNGSHLFSRTGKLLTVPPGFTSSFPRQVCLDGELWVGYNDFSKLTSLLRQTTQHTEPDFWKEVKFCVFDLPMHSGNYSERHAFASEAISGSGSNISLIPFDVCLGKEHLQSKLQQIVQKGGEGIMLYHPTAEYTPGRTTHLLKVKAFAEEDVKFVECNSNSYSFLCEQQNGIKCSVKCSGWEYLFPPSPGTVLTVKHSGLFEGSQKMKQPFLLRVRNDVTWKESLK